MCFCTDFDVFSFRETWAKSANEFSSCYGGFYAYSNFRKKRSKKERSHGGIIVYVKDNLLDGIQRISCDLEDAIFLVFEKTYFGFAKDVVYGSVYIPPESSSEYHFRSTDNGIDELENKLNDIVSKCNGEVDIVITGDFNSRTGINHAYIFDDDSKTQPNVPECYESDSFCILRQNTDHVVNNFGKSLLNMCCSQNIHILNCRIAGNKEGAFTCVASNGKSVVDYIIVSTTLLIVLCSRK